MDCERLKSPQRSWIKHARAAEERHSRPRIQRAADAAATPVEDVGVDHRRGDVAVAKQLLNGTDVVAVLEKMRGERVAQRMTAGGLGNAGGRYGSSKRA